MADIYSSAVKIEEKDYATEGGWLGSYIWADYLRISGVVSDKIRVPGKPQFDCSGSKTQESGDKHDLQNIELFIANNSCIFFFLEL